MAHYAQVTEADLQEAAKMTLLNIAEKRVQTTVEQARTESHESDIDNDVSSCFCGTTREYAKTR